MSLSIPATNSRRGEAYTVLRRIWAENSRSYRGLYAVAAACLIMVSATTALAAWIMKPLIDDLFVEHRFERAPLICGAIVAIFIVRGIATYGQGVTLSKIGNSMVARYQKRIFQHLMKLGVDFFSETRSGQLAARINENVTSIRDLLSITLKSTAGDLLSLVGLVGLVVAGLGLGRVVLAVLRGREGGRGGEQEQERQPGSEGLHGGKAYGVGRAS